jgi:hypothetical protein
MEVEVAGVVYYAVAGVVDAAGTFHYEKEYLQSI